MVVVVVVGMDALGTARWRTNTLVVVSSQSTRGKLGVSCVHEDYVEKAFLSCHDLAACRPTLVGHNSPRLSSER